MLKKILIANRGEIAVRIIRTCRDMGIATVAIYSETERDSLHVRLADECWPVRSELRYGDMDEVLAIARQSGADAIHPGYGFLSERADFAAACAEQGVVFIGPSPTIIAQLQNKIDSLERVQAAGFAVPNHSEVALYPEDNELLDVMATDMGYPLVVKSCSGGRGRGERVISSPARLGEMVAQARREAQKIYGSERVYLERAIYPVHQLAVQILADAEGHMLHLGEREGSLQMNNQKMIEESPAPCLSDTARAKLRHAALEIARLFGYVGAGSVEFLVDNDGNFYFTEIKARIQIEHAVSEMLTNVDIVAEQIRIASGAGLSVDQEDIRLHGWTMQCRINAEDPWNNYLPSPGELHRFRLPTGPFVRVDTYGYAGCRIPVRYDSLLANVVVWGETREQCVQRMRRALEDFRITGVQTNLTLHRHILQHAGIAAGDYDVSTMREVEGWQNSLAEEERRDLAIAAAVAFALRSQDGDVTMPARVRSGWHVSSRRLPS